MQYYSFCLNILTLKPPKQIYVPAVLLDYIFSLLHEKDELVNLIYIQKFNFLKDDFGDYDNANHFE